MEKTLVCADHVVEKSLKLCARKTLRELLSPQSLGGGDEGTEPQGGEGTCPRAHGKLRATVLEPGRAGAECSGAFSSQAFWGGQYRKPGGPREAGNRVPFKGGTSMSQRIH